MSKTQLIKDLEEIQSRIEIELEEIEGNNDYEDGYQDGLIFAMRKIELFIVKNKETPTPTSETLSGDDSPKSQSSSL